MTKEFIETKNAPAAVGPYSQGVRTEGLIFTSGQIPICLETGQVLTGDIKKETTMCLEYIKAVVEEAGSKVENIIKVTIFIKDMNDFPLINEAYDSFFGDHKPARACVEVARLPKDVHIEMEAIAVR